MMRNMRHQGDALLVHTRWLVVNSPQAADRLSENESMSISFWWDRESEVGEWEPEPHELPLVEPGAPLIPPSPRDEREDEHRSRVIVIELC
jgi:hypothetical protein